MIRKVLALFGATVACAAVAGFAVVGYKVWPLKAEVTRQADFFAGRANEAGDAADHAIRFVRDVLREADIQLAAARFNSSAFHSRAPGNPFLQTGIAFASHDLLATVERAQGAVVAASDAVRVADAALELAGADEYRDLNRLIGVSPEQLQATRSALGSIGGELRHARGLLSTADGVLTPEELDAVGGALDRARDFTSQMDQVIRTVRGRVNETRASVVVWAGRLAWAVTLGCTLGAVGHLFLLRFCWRKFHGLPA